MTILPKDHQIGANGGPSLEEQLHALADALVRFKHDPLGFCMYFWTWGVEGTDLAAETGPDQWQMEQLDEIGRKLRKDPHKPIRHATASGHGIGKSCLVAWLIIWGIMTYRGASARVTANSDTQLKSTTWAEVSKWFHLLPQILQDQFVCTATALYTADTRFARNWKAEAVPNSAANPAAFAGKHNAGKRLLMIIDEASEIPDVIYDTADGAMTDADTELLLLIFGNPTKNTGRFKEAVEGRFRHMWTAEQIDSRTVKRTNKAFLAEIVEAFGEDSDYARIRVRGLFPRQGSMQFIPSDLVGLARKREPFYIPSDPLVLGVDVAWYGDDASVMAPRRGNDARTISWERFRGLDPMSLAGRVAEWSQRFKPDAIFVDAGGVGAGVYSRLIQLQVPNVFGINFGGAPSLAAFNGIETRVANPRAAMYAKTREWLRGEASIPDESDVETDLCGVEYGFNTNNEIILEAKQHMKARGLASPDNADALALTFAFPIAPRQVTGHANPLIGVTSDYDPMAGV